MAVCCNGGFAALVCEREVGILWAFVLSIGKTSCDASNTSDGIGFNALVSRGSAPGTKTRTKRASDRARGAFAASRRLSAQSSI